LVAVLRIRVNNFEKLRIRGEPTVAFISRRPLRWEIEVSHQIEVVEDAVK
jgi:hypothetical protein